MEFSWFNRGKPVICTTPLLHFTSSFAINFAWFYEAAWLTDIFLLYGSFCFVLQWAYSDNAIQVCDLSAYDGLHWIDVPDPSRQWPQIISVKSSSQLPTAKLGVYLKWKSEFCLVIRLHCRKVGGASLCPRVLGNHEPHTHYYGHCDRVPEVHPICHRFTVQ